MITIEEALQAVYVAALGHSDDEVTRTAKQLAHTVVDACVESAFEQGRTFQVSVIHKRIDEYGVE